jgi:tetratricopeptide (TPR) repeat protein
MLPRFDARAFYRDLLAANPRAAPVRAQLARALLAAGDADAAIAESDIARADDPSLVDAWLVRADASRALRLWAVAADSLEHADRLRPGQTAILLALGTAYAELGRLEDAAMALSRAAALDPRDAAAAANLGTVYLRQDRADLAIAACRAALARDPDLVCAHQNLANLLARTDPRAARTHRDSAFRRQSLFVEPAARHRMTALVLTAAGPGNVPLDHLLPRAHVTLIRWYVEYATAEQISRLPPHDVVVNAIGDADCLPPVVPEIGLWLSERRVLNRFDLVRPTRRSDLPALLAGLDDVIVPACVFLDTGDDRKRVTPPVLIRPIGAHGGEGVRRVESADEILDALSDSGGCYATSFVDFRGADGMYRKYRAIFVDRVPYPYHLAITETWLVHYWNAGMGSSPARRAEEQRFLDDPAGAIGPKTWAAIAAIGARLDLDYAGIDFSVLPSGSVLVFEANATMLVHPEDDPMFAHKNDAVRRITDAVSGMMETIGSRGADRAAA